MELRLPPADVSAIFWVVKKKRLMGIALPDFVDQCYRKMWALLARQRKKGFSNGLEQVCFPAAVHADDEMDLTLALEWRFRAEADTDVGERRVMLDPEKAQSHGLLLCLCQRLAIRYVREFILAQTAVA